MDISLENLYCAYYSGSIHYSNAVFNELIDELCTAERILPASDSASSPFVTGFVIARLFPHSPILFLKIKLDHEDFKWRDGGECKILTFISKVIDEAVFCQLEYFERH